MTEAIKLLVVVIGSVFGTVGLIILLLYLTPNQVEKWAAILLKLALRLGIGVRTLHKQYVRHDFQSRVNDFVRKHCPTLPGAVADKVRLEWVDGSVSKKAILDGDVVVVRVKREDPQERSFVHAVCLFVSKSLLFKAKRYISAPQGEATDLFVSLKLLEREKPAAVAHFVDDYLQPAIDKKHSATARIFDDLTVVDSGQLFYAIYLQELNFLGNKVFGGRKDAVIVKEVDDLIEFLKNFVDREVGTEGTDLDFFGAYCRFAVVIVGKAPKLLRESIKPYVNFIAGTLMPAGVETVYLVAPAKNAPYVRQVAEAVSPNFEPYLEAKLKRKLRFKDRQVEVDTHLLILRVRGAKTYIEKAAR